MASDAIRDALKGMTEPELLVCKFLTDGTTQSARAIQD
jgi:hypothetical protein